MQADLEQSYSKRIEEMSKELHVAHEHYSSLESDFQKAQSELQTTQVIGTAQSTVTRLRADAISFFLAAKRDWRVGSERALAMPLVRATLRAK